MNLCFSIFRVLPFLAIAYPILGTTTPDQAKWSNENYSLYPGDFDGDGFSDILYVSKVRGGSSGIALSDGNGINISLQSWENTYLGIEWTSDLYNIVVADFDGDGRSDVLLQSKSEGDNYLLITEEGGIGGISQVIPNTFMGLEWTSKNHSLVAGDFTGDGRADLFLQATDSAGVNAIVAADKLGQFTAIQPLQIWNDGFAGFRWSAAEARIFSADFNGDGLSDLLIQAQPLPRNSETEPVQFEPNMNGVVTARADTEVFVTEGVQSWSQYGFDADWSPLSSQVIVGDFNEDGLSDVLLQGISDKNLSYLLFGRAKGSIFGSASGLDRKSVPSQTSDRLLFGHFTAEGSNLFAQSSSGSHANYIGVLSEGVVSKTVSDVSFTNIGTPIASADTEPLANVAEAAPVTPTSAGRTKGEFSASPDGAATYSIPIWTPPGARGLSPNLSLIYSSASGDGPLGPGWSLSGLSSIERCPKTYAANAGAPSAVSLTVNDDFCLDGARLRLISGTYGAADSIYGTEIANFSRVTAKLSAGNGPSYFIVERKNGLILEYGNTADSKAYTQSGSTTPYAWMLNKIRDRQGNNLKVAYSNTSGSVQPTTISYTQTPATGDLPGVLRPV